MWEELRAAGAELVRGPGVRCLVVTGEGPSFSAGIDLGELAGGDRTRSMANNRFLAPTGTARVRCG